MSQLEMGELQLVTCHLVNLRVTLEPPLDKRNEFRVLKLLVRLTSCTMMTMAFMCLIWRGMWLMHI
jgi:hypothetical protein